MQVSFFFIFVYFIVRGSTEQSPKSLLDTKYLNILPILPGMPNWGVGVCYPVSSPTMVSLFFFVYPSLDSRLWRITVPSIGHHVKWKSNGTSLELIKIIFCLNSSKRNKYNFVFCDSSTLRLCMDFPKPWSNCQKKNFLKSRMRKTSYTANNSWTKFNCQ